MNLLTRRIFLLGSGLTLASYLFYEVNHLRVIRYTVPVRNLPASFQGFTILHLSDLHQKRFGKNQANLFNLINGYHYDMVALTGDLINRFRPDGGPAVELVAGLTQKPCFFVNGNNESSALIRHGYRIEGRLSDVGCTTLDNASQPLSLGGEHIWIAGVDDLSCGKENLVKTLQKTGDGAPVVLLAHSPLLFSKAAEAGASLLLAGHTHGGQIRIPFAGALWVPDMGFLPRWDYGLFYQDKTTLIVNGGLGESVIPLRFNIPPEIVLVTLTSLKGPSAV